MAWVSVQRGREAKAGAEEGRCMRYISGSMKVLVVVQVIIRVAGVARQPGVVRAGWRAGDTYLSTLRQGPREPPSS